MIPSIRAEVGTEGTFEMSWAVFNINSVGEDLPDIEVDLLFSEFLRERIPLRARERGE